MWLENASITPARVTAMIHGEAQFPRRSVMTTGLPPRPRRNRSSSLRPSSAASCARVIVVAVSIVRYSAGMASNAAFSRIRSIFAAVASLGSTALSAAYASAAFVQSLAASWISAISASARASAGSSVAACPACVRRGRIVPRLVLDGGELAVEKRTFRGRGNRRQVAAPRVFELAGVGRLARALDVLLHGAELQHVHAAAQRRQGGVGGDCRLERRQRGVGTSRGEQGLPFPASAGAYDAFPSSALSKCASAACPSRRASAEYPSPASDG